MKVLVTGANGQLGSELRLISKNFQNYEWVFTDIKEVNLADTKNLKKNILKIFPEIIINCGAYTDVDGAENNRKISDIINFKAVDILSRWSYENNKKLIHISTDYVFNGNTNVPLTENFPTNPVNYYGLSKLKGEEICLKNNSNAIIIRTSWVYSRFGTNFVKTILSLMNKLDSINVVDDQIGSPTYAADLADVIMTIINSKEWISGIYHYSNEGQISWYEFAVKIKEIHDMKTIIKPVKTNYFKTIAKRPKYSLLDKSKIKNTYKIRVPSYETSLKRCLSILKDEK